MKVIALVFAIQIAWFTLSEEPVNPESTLGTVKPAEYVVWDLAKGLSGLAEPHVWSSLIDRPLSQHVNEVVSDSSDLLGGIAARLLEEDGPLFPLNEAEESLDDDHHLGINVKVPDPLADMEDRVNSETEAEASEGSMDDLSASQPDSFLNDGKEQDSYDIDTKTEDDRPTPDDVKEEVKDIINSKDGMDVSDLLNNLPNSVHIELEEAYVLNESVFTYTLDSDLENDEYIVVEVTGMGEFKLGMLSNRAPYITVDDTISIQGSVFGSIMPISSQYVAKGSMISFTSEGLMLLPIEIKLRRQRYLSLSFNENIQIIPNYAEFIRIKLGSPADLIASVQDTRLQFIAESGLQGQRLESHQELEMYINQKSGVFPTSAQNEIKASGSLGYGLIKTLSYKDKYFCAQADCTYYVTLKVKNIKMCNFFPTVFANGAEIRFSHAMSMIEELEVGEVITYKLVVPKSDENWLFTIIPTEGNSIMYINPDTKPVGFDGYRYKSQGEGVQNVIVTAVAAKANGSSHEVFYVSYFSLDPKKVSTLKFQARRQPNNLPVEILPSIWTTGNMADKETVNFTLDLKGKGVELAEVDLRFMTSTDKLILVLKECLEGELDCYITETDLDSARSEDMQAKYADRIARSIKAKDDVSSSTTLNLLLKFRCLEKISRTKRKEQLASKSCRFAVAVHADLGSMKPNTSFGLLMASSNTHRNIEAARPVPIILKTDEVQHYKLNVDHYTATNFKYAIFKVTALNGTCKLYISRTNATPNSTDFENVVEVKDDNMTSLETSIYYSSIEIGELPLDSAVYITGIGQDYCILDIYADFTNSAERMDDMIQQIYENSIIIARIDDDDLNDSTQGQVFSKIFLFEVPPYNEEMGFLNITVNTNKLGLNICVQEDVAEFDYSKGCTYFKDSENLTIQRFFKPADAGTKLLISVRKPRRDEQTVRSLPIEFSILVSFDKTSNPGIRVLAAGQSHSKLLLSQASITYQLHAHYMTESGLITLSTDHPSISASLSTSPDGFDNPIVTLTHTKFAARIKRVFSFKQKYCIDTECALYVKVLNASGHNYRFTLTYTVDDVPIALKDGSQVFIPSDAPQYFVTEADSNNSLVLNLFSETTSGIVYSKIMSVGEVRKSDISDLLDETKFDYKSELGTEVEITQAPGALAKFSPPIVGYYYAPKADISLHDSIIATYDQKDRTKVRMHSGILKLEPYYQTRFSTARGDFSYFFINMDEAQGFSVVLSVISGEADLFINPGMFNFTTTDFYWKKSATYKGDEITITKDMFADPQKLIDTYTIGVHARTASEYSVLFMPEFSNLIKIHYQSLVYLNLERDKYYYFDFFNKHKTFTTYFYAEDSDVEISVLNYDEASSQEFIDMISDEDKYASRMIFTHGSVPMKHISSNTSDIGTHYVIRARALGRDTKTSLAIYDEARPIEAYSEKRFDFVQDQDEEQVFRVKLGGDYGSVDVDVKLDFGEVSVYMSRDGEFLDDPMILDRPSQKYLRYKVESKNIVLIGELFVKVVSRRLSSYSVFVKPEEKFKEIKAFKTEIVYTSKEREQYIFFNFDESALASTTSLLIEMYSVNYYSEKPELLFLAASDVTLANDSPFIPMPLVDYYESNLGEFKHAQIVPELIKGYYVIKIGKAAVRLPVKISVNLNGVKQVEPNGIYRHNLLSDRANSSTYEMYIPEAGEFRFLVQTCSDAAIASAEFSSDAGAKTFPFEEQFNQVYSFVRLDKRDSKDWKRQQREISYPIKRGVVDSAGLLKFNVTSDGLSFFDVNQAKLDYFLISEFRPAKRNLILKDYIDIYTDREAFEAFNVAYKFTDRNTRLSLKTSLPRIKGQALQDFPSVKKVQYRIYYYLLADDSEFMQRLARCGSAAISTVPSKDHMQQKTVSVKAAVDEDIQFTMYFFKNDLEAFASSTNVSVYVQLEIYFFENEEEEFGISLDVKMAEVPFLLVTIPNFYKGWLVDRLAFFACVVFAACLVIWALCIIGKWCKKPNEEHDYERGDEVSRNTDVSSNKLNISDITTI